MKRKLMLLFFALATLLAVSAAPVYADDEAEDNPPPCEQCDGGQVWSG